MDLEQERLDDFQTRMNEWVGRQGFLFQIRYGGSVQGARGNTMSMVIALFVRLVILGLLAALLVMGYLFKRVDLKSFRQGVSADLQQALGAEELEARGIKHGSGALSFNAVNAIGGKESFFEDLELRGVKMQMSLTDGIIGPWDGDSISLQSLVVRIKGGAETDEEAARAYEALFHETRKFKLTSFRVSQASLQWGYSSSNRGSISNSRLAATRRTDSWHLVFKGGTFSQNWLEELHIDHMEVELTKDGVEIHEARLSKDGGAIGLTLNMVEGGAVPRFRGSGRFEGLPLDSFLDEDAGEFAGGTMSGEFLVDGSTNSQKGFEMEFDVRLNEEAKDEIELRDSLAILRAISTADRIGTHKKLKFRSGGFRFVTASNTLRITDLSLVASRLMRLEGEMLFRPPTTEEVEEGLEGGPDDAPEGDDKQRPLNAQSPTSEGESGAEGEFEFSLRRALAEEKKGGEDEDGEEDFDERFSSIIRDRGLREEQKRKARERQQDVQRVDGLVRMGVVPTMLERTPELAEAFPVDEETDLRWVEIDFQGTRISEMTEAEAARIFELSRE